MERDHWGREIQSKGDGPENNSPGVPGKRTLTESLAIGGVASSNPTPLSPGKRTLTEMLPIPRATPPSSPETQATGERSMPNTGRSDDDPGALPAPVRGRMEAAFGSHLGHVRIHQGSGQAAAMGAVAFTQGSDIHFAPGAYDPSSTHGQELIGHELAHVVQQGEGRVQATRQAKGLGVNDDEALEREADDWGARAARGERVGRGAITAGTAASATGPMQMKTVRSHWGTFEGTNYLKNTRGDGVDIDLSFTPLPKVDATKIGLVQSVKNTTNGRPKVIHPTEKLRMVSSGPNAGHKIDRRAEKTNPVYGARDVASSNLEDTQESNALPGTDPTKATATYKLGRHVPGDEKPVAAWMHDSPSGDNFSRSGVEFETTALALEGVQQGTYYGSVKWGYDIDAAGRLRTIELTGLSAGAPSQHFLAAAAGWNAATALGTLVVARDNTPVWELASMTARLKLPKGTKVEVRQIVTVRGVTYNEIVIPDSGPHAGQSGYVKPTDLVDNGDGPPTTDLPVPDIHVLNEAHELKQDAAGPRREIRMLAQGTRVVTTTHARDQASPGQVWIKVVDGPDIGAEGQVDSGKLTAERP